MIKFPKVHSIIRYCSLFLIVFLQQHVVLVSSTRNYTELMKECNEDFCVCINRNVDNSNNCPWPSIYFPLKGKEVRTVFQPAFRILICQLIDNPIRSDGLETYTTATIDDVGTTQFAFVNITFGTERVVAAEDVNVTRLFKISETYYYSEDSSFSFTPFDLITCPSTIAPTAKPFKVPSPTPSFSDNIRNDALLGLMVLVIANACMISGF